MTDQPAPALEFTLQRRYPAPPDRVFAFFVDPALMARWFCPNPGLSTVCTLDPVVGGEWQVTMGSHVVGGRYRRVEPPHLVEFTWAWAGDETAPVTVVRVALAIDGNGTLLRLEHREDTPDVGDDGHRGGWDLSLDRLGAVLVTPGGS